ncbi:MAG: hypothetical protein QM763_23910 [Agriterribacter sp.]
MNSISSNSTVVFLLPDWQTLRIFISIVEKRGLCVGLLSFGEASPSLRGVTLYIQTGIFIRIIPGATPEQRTVIGRYYRCAAAI